MRLSISRLVGRAAAALLIAVCALAAAPAMGHAAPAPVASASAAMPPMDDQMMMTITETLEREAEADLRAAPQVPAALAELWHAMDHDGSGGAAVVLGWIALAALIALAAEKLPVLAYGHWRQRRIRQNRGGATMMGLLALLASDIGGVAIFALVFALLSRRWFQAPESAAMLAMVASAVLIRWRIAVLVLRIVLRPTLPVARLVPLGDGAAARLACLVSGAILIAIALVAFSRSLVLAGLDHGVLHVVSLTVSVTVCVLLAVAAICGRGAVEALIRGEPSDSAVSAMRAAVAPAWVAFALLVIVGLMLLFAFGLSLGLLRYYYAVTSTLGILLVLVVLEALSARAWRELGPTERGARIFHRMLPAALLTCAVIAIARVWVDAIRMSSAEADRITYSITAAILTLLTAYAVWEAGKHAIDRHLQKSSGPVLPGDDDELAAPASRLQTVLPFLRAALGVVIAVLAMLIVLSRLGIDTGPLIAGAGVLGLAISFGSQSLIRDIISGLFYIWDDAFRVNEYIDTGRLKGTVEALGVRSVKLRHQNGPLHTIPYGQLGAVSNLSRDFATIKFNLRLELGTDIELVRKTVKQIGLQMQDNPEIAAEILLPLKLQGVADIDNNAVVVRLKFTSRPVKPSWVQREYLKRLYQVFAEKGINFASNALTLQTLPALPAPEGAATAAAAAPAAPVVALPAPPRVA
ncbi:MAG TPA: mechanosensitive ion channel domain-containing protein [Stellaceae bacterium]|nr:mechanosensitive ion channel domain-containing protein [Stellaceae bacterium]